MRQNYKLKMYLKSHSSNSIMTFVSNMIHFCLFTAKYQAENEYR